MEAPRSKREAYRNALITPLTVSQRPRTPWKSPSPRLLSPSTKSNPSPHHPHPPPPSQGTAAASLETSEREELQKLVHAPPFWKSKKRLSKQLSMCETARDIAWEKRRRQMLRQERRKNGIGESDYLTDEDLHELKGCIELGFGFKEVEGQRLCNTLPALDLYFAVNRQLSPSPVSTPHSGASASSLGAPSSSLDSPRSSEDSWRICGPGDNPEQVKTKLRHWAQAVACSVMQST
ncbi:hypothetical protein Dimus_021809 [Dionaea muscipula]